MKHQNGLAWAFIGLAFFNGGRIYAACAGATVSGNVSMAETGASMAGILVELRDAFGHVLLPPQYTTGALPNNYSFCDPAGVNGTSYFVDVGLGRQQYVKGAPGLFSYVTVAAGNATANFTVGGTPATIQVSATPGTFVLVSTFAWTGAAPPSVNQANVSVLGAYSSVIATNGSVSFSVPTGTTVNTIPYYVLCWVLQAPDTATPFAKIVPGGGSPISGGSGVGGNLLPLNSVSLTCP